MNILRDLQYELPADFDLSAQVPRNTIMGAIIGIVAILAMAIILTVYIRKRQKGGIFDIIVGVAVYMIFFYFASTPLLTCFWYNPQRVLSTSSRFL